MAYGVGGGFMGVGKPNGPQPRVWGPDEGPPSPGRGKTVGTQGYAKAYARLLEVSSTSYGGMSCSYHSVSVAQEPALSIHDLRHRNVLSESGIHEKITSTRLPGGIEHMLSMILVKSVS